ncbi:hypothetical protein [Chromobacterium haemolyticum]|uniref:hypothetical protein n=1 Tax=Chromobacterium haemolyticum TaxID=394935 RepID=UPI00244A6CB9|nr:hypothetical protein [Chromobacterium haemolyticum]MDH0342086.1 hypothetical protein [Chromobacterium haemolyticum]
MQTGQFYLQDSRSHVGDNLQFWATAGNGYKTDLSQLQVYTHDEALAQHHCRETDIPWPKAYIDARAHRGVDQQHVDPDEAVRRSSNEERFYAAYPNEFNGNDLIFASTTGGRTADLRVAAIYSKEEVPALVVKGLRPLPAGYIDAKSRQLVRLQHVSIKEALRGTGIKLIKPRPERRPTYNCAGCGRFLNAEGYYGGCPHCSTVSC